MTISPQSSGFYTFPLEDDERELLGSCHFLTKEWIMQRLSDWKPIRGLVSINILLYNVDGKPTHKQSEMFVLPKGEDTIISNLANLSDIHGLIGLYSGSLWLVKVSNVEDLNIDADVMNRIQSILRVASEEEEQRLLKEENKKVERRYDI